MAKKKQKSVWLSNEAEWIGYIFYVALSLYLRRHLFALDPVPYSKLFVSIVVGTLGLIVGISSIKERRAGFHSITYKDKDAIIFGVICIIISIILMLFVGR